MAKCCLFLMPIIILLEGILYFGLSIWGLIMRECSNQIIDIANSPFGFVMDIIYFFDEMCGNPNVTVAGFSEPLTLIESNFREPTISRTEAFLICYLVISALWIFFSVFTLSTITCTASKNATILSYILWYSSVLGGCILDAVATGFYIHDVFHTTSADNTFEYLGLSTTESVMAYIRSFDGYFVAPSLVMMCISSRIFFIWIFNIFGSCHCISVFNKHLKNHSVATSSNVLVADAENQPSRRQ